MQPPDFPPNNAASKQGKAKKEKIERVTSGEVVRRKKSLRKQFTETFVAGDAKSAVRYVVFDILLTAARDMVVEAAQGGVERLIYGDSRSYRGTTRPESGATGYINYNRIPHQMGRGAIPSAARAMSRAARARHDFDEIILNDRSEAEDVIDTLFDLVNKYDEATVADLYELLGVGSTHTDHRWGWTNLKGAGVSRVRSGYLLDLPDPIPLD